MNGCGSQGFVSLHCFFKELDFKELDFKGLDLKQLDIKELDFNKLDVKEFDFTELDFTQLHFKELDFINLTELFRSPPSHASACVHEWLPFARHSGRHDTRSFNYWSSSAGNQDYVPHQGHGVSHGQNTEIILVLQWFQRRLVVFRHP